MGGWVGGWVEEVGGWAYLVLEVLGEEGEVGLHDDVDSHGQACWGEVWWVGGWVDERMNE